MLQLGWKVVAGVKALKPATELALQRVRYYFGQWTCQEPKEFGPFAVFETRDQAEDFASRQNCRVVLCFFEISEEDTLWKKGKPDFVKSRFRSGGYYAQATEPETRHLSDCPEGTVFAQAVKPILFVEEIEERKTTVFAQAVKPILFVEEIEERKTLQSLPVV